jgi:TRAP-type C4-dicarboxylate transport system substrate-binding protein
MTTKGPAELARDAKGKKLRTFPNEMMRWTLEAMGFNIQIMPLPEVYLAIQQGAVQGQENPIDTIYSNKFYEVAPNITLTNHVYSPIPLAISEKTWQKLSPRRPEGRDRSGQDRGKFSREMIAGNDDNQLKEMAAKGAKVNAKPDVAAFRKRSAGLRQGAREVRRRRRPRACRSRGHPQEHQVGPCRRRPAQAGGPGAAARAPGRPLRSTGR